MILILALPDEVDIAELIRGNKIKGIRARCS